jgi:type IV pilus assembly protein PilQ
MRTWLVLSVLFLASPVVASSPSVSSGGASSAKRFSGKKIDLDFRDANVRDVLTLLADVGRVTLVMDDVGSAKITLKLRDTPWDQVLDVVAREARLSYERESDRLTVRRAR